VQENSFVRVFLFIRPDQAPDHSPGQTPDNDLCGQKAVIPAGQICFIIDLAVSQRRDHLFKKTAESGSFHFI